MAAAIALGAVSCAEESSQIEEEELEPSEESELGSLTLNLTGADSQGRQYRLRQAYFHITNYVYYGDYYPSDGGAATLEILSTEDDPDAPTLSTRLVPGNYYVSLQDSWYIERLTPTGPERIERAVLLSERQQYTWIYQGGVSQLAFRFGVDGDLIDFRHGDLVIDAEFELPEDEDYPRDAGWGPRTDGGTRRDAGSIYVDAGVAR